jgi:hypothetical protein
MQTIVCSTASPYGYPKLTGSVSSRVEFFFRLHENWQVLYDQADNNTHKIAGVSDFFGVNSQRLGVRKSPNADDKLRGLIPVAYTHINGKRSYPAIKTPEGKRILLRYDQLYFCRQVKNGCGWTLTLYTAYQVFIAQAYTSVCIDFFPRLSGLYVEPAQNVSIEIDLINP